ncbi:hypothetical protein PoB_005227600 [Plakobranchus ocellatus]|uniref:Uncharacterized protein n=1 Tax=Plakobranchus ocellatus TaxID=259542 RepID=A0AAV4C309_9GAST|nr:hypothetical protein PoB_005227600 [Plakobranchus ocellatus]
MPQSALLLTFKLFFSRVSALSSGTSENPIGKVPPKLRINQMVLHAVSLLSTCPIACKSIILEPVRLELPLGRIVSAFRKRGWLICARANINKPLSGQAYKTSFHLTEGCSNVIYSFFGRRKEEEEGERRRRKRRRRRRKKKKEEEEKKIKKKKEEEEEEEEEEEKEEEEGGGGGEEEEEYM